MDKYGAYVTPSTNQFECAYKTKTDGKMCAVNTYVAPLKSTFDASKIASLPDPIDYCSPSEVSNAVCVTSPVSATLVRNYDVCTKPIAISKPDLLVTKTADKGFFSTGDTIVYTITVKNIGSGVAK